MQSENTVKVRVEKTERADEQCGKFPGLCLTCLHAGECTFPRDSRTPVMHCDEFDGEVKTVEQKPVPRGTAMAPAEKASTLKGLCKICAKSDVCVFPKPDSGVWNCEEYE